MKEPGTRTCATQQLLDFARPVKKQCGRCREIKPRSAFNRRAGRKCGLQGLCRECSRAANNTAYVADKRRVMDRVRRSQLRYPERKRARSAVEYAVLRGRLTRQPCEDCSAGGNVQAHHDDYSMPLDVRWLCVGCHRQLHAQEVAS